jgi:hypothetical protein
LYQLLTIKDFIVVPVLLMVAYLWANRVKNKNLVQSPYYRYFAWGLWAKIAAGLAFAAVYLFYYGGGDTVYYFFGSASTVKMAGKDFWAFIRLLYGDHSAEIYSLFDRSTGWPLYWRDINSYAVSRFNVPFYLLGLGSYLGNTIVMNLFLYLGTWHFFKLLLELYPRQEKALAWALLFVPSVVFWTSGILKDGWTLTAILFMFVTIYRLFIKRQKFWKNLFILLFWSYIAFSIRPYIFYVSIGSGLIWLTFTAIKAIQSSFLRTIALPFLVFLAWISGAIIIAQTGELAGSRYSSLDAMLETAWIIQDDLKKDYYGGNSFDIGTFEPTLSGVLGKAPKAIVAGLFRPFVWEGQGALMLLSGLENLILLLLVAWVLLKTGPFRFFSRLYHDPLILSLFVFALTFAFFVGLTTANFGALVRYVVPGKLLMVLVVVLTYKKDKIQLTS